MRSDNLINFICSVQHMNASYMRSMLEQHGQAWINAAETLLILSHIDFFVFPQHKFSKNDNIKCIASDLLLLRPCIEHYMLGVILGRGGGPEELGATFGDKQIFPGTMTRSMVFGA